MNVFITGASGGLGRAIAVECARRGYKLFLTDINQAGLDALKLGLERQYGADVAAIACDLTNSGAVDSLLGAIDAYGMRFDMLLNIAGIDFEGSFMSRPREEIIKIISLNNAAALRITHAVLERRREGRRFYAVFVSSLASMYPMPLKATYAASKRFLLDFAMALRQELRHNNAVVLALCPGGMATNNEVIAAMEAQGFWGRITTNGLETVAHKTIDHALKGHAVYVPGVFNHFLAVLSRIMPRTLAAGAIYWRWSRAQQKWLNG